MYGMVGYKLCFFGTFILQRKEREGERDRQTESTSLSLLPSVWLQDTGVFQPIWAAPICTSVSWVRGGPHLQGAGLRRTSPTPVEEKRFSRGPLRSCSLSVSWSPPAQWLSRMEETAVKVREASAGGGLASALVGQGLPPRLSGRKGGNTENSDTVYLLPQSTDTGGLLAEVKALGGRGVLCP